MVPPSGVELFLRGRALDPGSRGFAGREDAPAAARLYRQAAGLGHVPALVNLALMLEEGRGVPRDLAQAGQCYRAAAEAGDPLARQYLAEGQFGPAAPPLWLEPEICVTDGTLRTVLRGWREWSCQLAEELRRVWLGTFTYRRTVLRGSWTAWQRAVERAERRGWCERQLGRARTKRWRRYLALWRTGVRDESILDRLSEHQLSRARNRRCQRGWDSWRDQAEAGAARDDLVTRHREDRRDWAVERCWDQWWVGAQLAGGLDRASETHLARRRLNQLAACWSVWAVQAHETRAAVHWCVVQLHRGWKRFRRRQARLQALDAETHWLACRLIGAVARWRMLVGQQQSQASRLEMHWRAVLLWAVRRMTLAMQQWQWVVQSRSGAGQLEDRAALLWSVDRMALAMRRWGLLCAGFWIRYGFGCWQAVVEQARKVRLGVVRLTLMLVGELPSSRGGPRPLAGSESKHLWSDQLLGLGCERLGMVVAALVGVLVPSAALGVAEGHGRSIDCIMRPWKAAVTAVKKSGSAASNSLGDNIAALSQLLSATEFKHASSWAVHVWALSVGQLASEAARLQARALEEDDLDDLARQSIRQIERFCTQLSVHVKAYLIFQKRHESQLPRHVLAAQQLEMEKFLGLAHPMTMSNQDLSKLEDSSQEIHIRLKQASPQHVDSDRDSTPVMRTRWHQTFFS